MTSLVIQFQKEVAKKLSIYFEKQFIVLKNKNPQLFDKLTNEYDKQFQIVNDKWDFGELTIENSKNKPEVLLQCISEAETRYNLGEIYGGLSNRIYSPRADLAITPIVKVINGKDKPLGIYKLSDDVKIIDLLYDLDFIKPFEKKLFQKAKENYLRYDIHLFEKHYINKRPLHLFSIEIENGTDSKYLMGDFLNALSLGKIPLVIVPKKNFDKSINLLLYSMAIYDIKEVDIFNILNKILLLTVEQFRNIINSELDKMDIPHLEVIDYR